MHELSPDETLDGNPVPTVEEAYIVYTQVRKLKTKTKYGYAQCYKKLTSWHHLPVNKITKAMIQQKHQEISVSSPSIANSTMRFLRSLLTFASDYYDGEDGRSILPTNPVRRLSAAKLWNKDNTRVWNYIKEEDIGIWFRAVKALEHRTISDFFMFLLFTGMRSGEAGSLTWDDVNTETATIFLKPDDTKNQKGHEFPVSKYVNDMLKERKLWARSKYVFTSYFDSQRPLGEFRKTTTMVTKMSGVEFKPHDLRRTFSRIIGHPEVAGTEIEVKGLLNHISGDVSWIHYFRLNPARMRPVVEGVTNFVLKRAIEAAPLMAAIPTSEAVKRRYKTPPITFNMLPEDEGKLVLRPAPETGMKEKEVEDDEPNYEYF